MGGGTDETEVNTNTTSQQQNFGRPFVHQNKQSGGNLQLSSSVPVHWNNSEGPGSKYSNNELTANYSQNEVTGVQSTGSTTANERSNFAVAESITALLKDLPGESSKNFGGDSNRSSVDEPHQQPV